MKNRIINSSPFTADWSHYNLLVVQEQRQRAESGEEEGAALGLLDGARAVQPAQGPAEVSQGAQTGRTACSAVDTYNIYSLGTGLFVIPSGIKTIEKLLYSMNIYF